MVPQALNSVSARPIWHTCICFLNVRHFMHNKKRPTLCYFSKSACRPTVACLNDCLKLWSVYSAWLASSKHLFSKLQNIILHSISQLYCLHFHPSGNVQYSALFKIFSHSGYGNGNTGNKGTVSREKLSKHMKAWLGTDIKRLLIYCVDNFFIFF
jgi:hypothetical protein